MGTLDRSALVERSDGFNYGYAMNCTCARVSVLSAEDYYVEADGAHMNCAHCGTSIHFGVAVAALRNQDDPALDDEAVARFAWYHTSTEPDWPSSDYAHRFIQDIEQYDHRPVNRAHYVSMHTTKALHLGTYETAVENMLRRMHDEHDGGSQFYLYRVAIDLRPGRINPGYRDENHDNAAQLSVSELDRDSLDAVRYLNVHEGTGVLSLAIRPEVITAVQRIPIPLPELALPPISGLLDREISALAHAQDEMEAAQAKVESIPHARRRMMCFGIYDDPDGLAKNAGDLEHRYIDLWNQLEDQLAEAYLPSVSRPIRRDFNEAMGSWKSAKPSVDTETFISRYRTLAVLLEKSSEVISKLSHQPWRDSRSL